MASEDEHACSSSSSSSSSSFLSPAQAESTIPTPDDTSSSPTLTPSANPLGTQDATSSSTASASGRLPPQRTSAPDYPPFRSSDPRASPPQLLRRLSHCSSASSITLVASPPPPSRSAFPSPKGAYTSMTSEQASSYKGDYHHDQAPSRTYRQPHEQQREPLVDLVTNDWRTNPKHEDFDDVDDEYDRFIWERENDDFKLPPWLQKILSIRVPRKVQRYLLFYLLFLLTCWFTWLYYLQPAWEENRALTASLLRASRGKATFGVNMRPEFTDMIQVKELEANLVPGSANADPSARLVVVGDVHGCKDELIKLLQKVSFSPKTDHLILTGDIIAKGPDSPGVVSLASRLRASCVRGNHEDRVLLAYAEMNSRLIPLPGPSENTNSTEDKMDEESFSHGDYKARALARQLNKEQIAYLQSCPVILRAGDIKDMGQVLVAHAGLVPNVPLQRQDPFQAMNMRSIDIQTRVPSEDRKAGAPWEKVWNHAMKHGKKEERATVLYGHDAKTGLNLKRWTKGLDSGCVRGGKLTALVVDGSGKEKVVSVSCKDRRKE